MITKENIEQKIQEINNKLNDLYNNYNTLQNDISCISRQIVQLQGQLGLLLELKKEFEEKSNE
ncbi:MAG: hypothetical protein NZ839_02870 [Endomicrobia bacterium]|nr:hypothetical protein [Endomicrobiia bacterium]